MPRVAAGGKRVHVTRLVVLIVSAGLAWAMVLTLGALLLGLLLSGG